MTKRDTLTIDRQEYSLLYGLWVSLKHGYPAYQKHIEALDEFYAKESEELRALSHNR